MKDFPVENKGQLDEQYQKHSAQFKLVREHNTKLWTETVDFLGELKVDLPEEEKGETNE